jgi:hypothetical protein
MERHDIKPDWTTHNGGLGGKPKPEPIATEPEATEPEEVTADTEKPVKNDK